MDTEPIVADSSSEVSSVDINGCMTSFLAAVTTETTSSAVQLNGSSFTLSAGVRRDFEQVNMQVLRYVVFVLYLVTFVVGAVGNTITIVAIAANQRLKRSAATCFMLNLAVADDLFILSLPFMAHSTLYKRWAFGGGLCKVLSVLHGVNGFASIFTMTAMSVDRYLAVVRPLTSRQYRTPRTAAGACTATWIACAIIMLPYWLYADVSTDGPSSCQMRWPSASKLIHHSFWTGFEFTIGFATPVIVMGIGYARLLRGLIYATRTVDEMDEGRDTDTRRGGVSPAGGNVPLVSGGVGGEAPGSARLASSDTLVAAASSGTRKARSSSAAGTPDSGRGNGRTRRQIRRVTVMVFAVTAAFVICWTPYHIVRFMSLHKQWAWSKRGVKPSQSEVLMFAILNTVAQALVFVSSCCNPFIYCISSSNFRRVYLMVMCRCCVGKGALRRYLNPSTTSAVMGRCNRATRSGVCGISLQRQPITTTPSLSPATLGGARTCNVSGGRSSDW